MHVGQRFHNEESGRCFLKRRAALPEHMLQTWNGRPAVASSLSARVQTVCAIAGRLIDGARGSVSEYRRESVRRAASVTRAGRHAATNPR